jgi:deazaflavin-dependent oxidoreductase (nitroreductase family)
MTVPGALFGLALRVHAFVYEHTDGRLGHRLLGVPTLLLRTRGRRTGAQRCSALAYAPDGDRHLVVASKGGADHAPGWLHNVRADPRVEVQVGRERFIATATIVERGDPEFDRVWKLVNDNNGGRYDDYQSRTSRPIPVVALAREGMAL